jgi:hypothetical protein
MKVVLPIFKQVVGKHVRLRMLSSYGSCQEVLKSVEQYGLNPIHVNEAFGGGAHNRATAAAWLKKRHEIELTHQKEKNFD